MTALAPPPPSDAAPAPTDPMAEVRDGRVDRGGRARRIGLVVLIVVAVLAVAVAVAAVYWGGHHREVALRWEQHAEAARRDLLTAEGDLDVALAENVRINQQVSSQNSQLEAVANDKAALGDVEKVLQQLKGSLPKLTESAVDCADGDPNACMDVAYYSANLNEALAGLS